MSDAVSNKKLCSQEWFDNPDNPGTTALYVERYLNQEYTRGELQGDRPAIGIANTGSDLSPCNKIPVFPMDRFHAGIRDADGVPMEFPVHPIQKTGKRPTAALDRILAYLSLVEVLHGNPIYGVVLTTGCDKTTPAMLMGAATVDLPAIALNGGPMPGGWWRGELAGSTAIPVPFRERMAMAYETGRRVFGMVHEDLKPSDVLTRDAVENAIVTNSAIGGSTNAPSHLQAIARHAGVALSVGDWQEIGFDVPLPVNMQPACEYLGERIYRTRGVPATMGEPLRAKAGFLVLSGNLFGSALKKKTSVNSEDFQRRFLSKPRRENVFEATAVVFEGPEDHHERVNDPDLKIGEDSMPFIRGVGCVGYPGSAEVVNMRPPDAVIRAGIDHLPTVGDGRRRAGLSADRRPGAAGPERLVVERTGRRGRMDLGWPSGRRPSSSTRRRGRKSTAPMPGSWPMAAA